MESLSLFLLDLDLNNNPRVLFDFFLQSHDRTHEYGLYDAALKDDGSSLQHSSRDPIVLP